MNSDLLAILDYFERDSGVSRDIIAQAIEEAIETAARRSFLSQKVKVNINPKTGDVGAVVYKKVVEKVKDPAIEISILEAREQKGNENIKVGEEVPCPIPPKELGRIVAQASRQGIMQRIKQAEREQICQKYKKQIGELFYGTVLKKENRGDIILEIEGQEGLLPASECIPGETLNVGDHVAVLLTEVNPKGNVPPLVFSRIHPDLLRKLFQREVTEIAEGIVKIHNIVREPGVRAKMTVSSTQPNLDPVGACVGVRGSRVKTIIRELNGERIDIIPWSPDIKQLVQNALQPAKILSLRVDESKRRVYITVATEHLSQTIGKGGQNARLASKLIGWKIDIKPHRPVSEDKLSLEEKVSQAAERLAKGLEISEELARKLVDHGFLSMEGICVADIDDLCEIPELTEEQAKQIKQIALSKTKL